MEKSYHLYLSTYNNRESHALNIFNSANLDEIKQSILNVMRAMFKDATNCWWYSEKYIDEKATEMVKPMAGLLENDSKITKLKFPFYHLGFIITNYPMWPDNNGGYEKDFCI